MAEDSFTTDITAIRERARQKMEEGPVLGDEEEEEEERTSGS